MAWSPNRNDAPFVWRYHKGKSASKACGMCGAPCVQYSPIIPRGTTPARLWRLGKPPRTRLECPNGHHTNPAWFWVDLWSQRAGR